MLSGRTHFELDLEPGQAVSLFGGAGCEILCLSGEVLLSEENDPADVGLHAGEGHRLIRSGRAVLESAGGSPRARIRLYPTPRAGH